MKTADIKVGRTYAARESYGSSNLYEVLEVVLTQDARRTQLRQEAVAKGLPTRYNSYRDRARRTIRVRILGSLSRYGGVHLTREDLREEVWVEPQRIDREVDLDQERTRREEELARKAKVDAARRAREEELKLTADALNDRLEALGLPRSVAVDEYSRRVAPQLKANITVETLEALLTR